MKKINIVSHIKTQLFFYITCFLVFFVSVRFYGPISFEGTNTGLGIIAKSLINALYLLPIINIIYIITRRKKTTYILFLFLSFFLFFINYMKESFLSMPLLPGDFLLIKEALIATPAMLKTIIISSVFFMFICLYLCLKKEKRINERLIIPLSIALMLLATFIFIKKNDNFSSLCKNDVNSIICKITLLFPDTKQNWIGDNEAFKSFGYTTFFISKSLDYVFFDQKEVKIPLSKIEKILSFNKEVGIKSNNPNVVIIMSEAHWNASWMGNNIPDTTPTIDNLQISKFMSPAFGGQTANVEFEALTGLSTYMNEGDLMYITKIKRPIYSLARYFNKHGYQSIAMHNNGKDFYNRNYVYPKLGFSKFISITDMADDDTIAKNKNSAGWVDDKILYNSLYNELKSNDTPKFIYAITVENHGLYNDQRFPEDDTIVLPTELTDKTKTRLRTYLSGTKRADKNLATFLKKVGELHKNTLVIFYGDHLPNLQDTYSELGFINNGIMKDKKYYETPLALWSNFPFDKSVFDKPQIQSIYLASTIIKSLKMPLDSYFNILDKMQNCYVYVHKIGIKETGKCSTQQLQVLSEYQDINTDILDGENNTYKILSH